MAPNPEPPEGANAGCPGGPGAAEAGRADACAGCPNQAACRDGSAAAPDPDLARIARRLAGVKHKLLVLSGKGGVGKSTVAAQLAFSLAARGFEVGLLDIDICGPSVPKMLGLEGEEIHQSNAGWSPVYVADNLGVMSIGFMLPNPDDAVVWRGPRKNGLIKQFLRDVDWGELDYLIVDSPPGTSDEHISIAQYLKATGVDGAVVVTTPQEVALADVRKEINFCRKTAIDVLGVVENMKYLDVRLDQVQFVQRGEPAGAGPPQDVTGRVRAALEAQGLSLADLGVRATVLPASGGGAARLAEQMGVRVLGSIPLVPEVSLACEKGEALADLPGDSPAKTALRLIVDRVVAATGGAREGMETG